MLIRRCSLHVWRRLLCDRVSYSMLHGLACVPVCHANDSRDWCTSLKRTFAVRVQNHYDLLGITPKASQIQVKAAYYRLSKKYHPDVNKSKDAAQLFSQISQAYEILGNVRNRRMYDQGFLNPTRTSVEYDDIDVRDLIRRDRKQPFGRRGPVPKGKTEHFDFDEFYRQHYGETLRKKREGMREKEQYEQWLEEDIKKRRAAIVLYTIGVVGFGIYMWIGS